jgi:hypothetical protein
MKGDEARVVAAFCGWLEREGWTVRPDLPFCDVCAERGQERLFAEAKGRTLATGLDVDTAYGQLLRRMPPEEVGHAQFGIVVPAEARAAALRVPKRVRDALRIAVYVVEEDGSVEAAED